MEVPTKMHVGVFQFLAGDAPATLYVVTEVCDHVAIISCE